MTHAVAERAFATRRIRFFILVTAIFALGTLLAPRAGATVTPTMDLQLSDTRLGAHADTTIKFGFDYGHVDPMLYPPTSPLTETVKDLVVDIPRGLVGNPNAVPYEDRCDPVVFETGLCPASATVGTFKVVSTLLGSEEDWADYPPEVGDTYVNLTIPGTAGSTTRLSLLKTDPESPATFGIWIQLPFGFPVIRQKILIGPDTNSDLKLRTTTIDPVARSFDLSDGTPGGPLITYFIRVNSIEIKFLGTLANGGKFMTNPTSCTKWASKVWARTYMNNSDATEDPLGMGVPYKSDEAPPITPDCTNQFDIPFPITGTTTISSNSRDVSPDFDFTIELPGVQADGDLVSTTPRKIVNTVPASINVDIHQLGRLCETDQFAADACPAATRVGTVGIETPLIRAGLQGDVYLVRAIGRALPDLGMHIRGAIHFTQKGHVEYVGERNDQIQTTFDDVPAVGFSKLNVHLFGGEDGLLRTLKCPEGRFRPKDGSFTYRFTSYTNQTVSSVATPKLTNCFGIQNLRKLKCIGKKLRLHPTYSSRARLRYVRLNVDGRRVETAHRPPFHFRVKARRFKTGRHKYELRAFYDDGTVSAKRGTFKRCR